MAVNSPSQESAAKRKKAWLTPLITLIILVIIVVLAVCLWPKANKASYQAVFISNGQVYFGKLAKETKQYAELSDIYYLQLSKQLQTQEAPVEGAAASQPQTKLTLIKLGNELHGPMDTMRINKDHILFVEDLKSDSKVAQAIAEYQKTQAGK